MKLLYNINVGFGTPPPRHTQFSKKLDERRAENYDWQNNNAITGICNRSNSIKTSIVGCEAESLVRLS